MKSAFKNEVRNIKNAALMVWWAYNKELTVQLKVTQA